VTCCAISDSAEFSCTYLLIIQQVKGRPKCVIMYKYLHDNKNATVVPSSVLSLLS